MALLTCFKSEDVCRYCDRHSTAWILSHLGSLGAWSGGLRGRLHRGDRDRRPRSDTLARLHYIEERVQDMLETILGEPLHDEDDVRAN